MVPRWRSSRGVAAQGHAVYVVDGGGVAIVDASIPEQPRQMAYWPSPRCAAGIALDGHLLFVANREGGVQVLWAALPVTVTIANGGGGLRAESDRTTYAFPAGAFPETVGVSHAVHYPGRAPTAGAPFRLLRVFSVEPRGSNGW